MSLGQIDGAERNRYEEVALVTPEVGDIRREAFVLLHDEAGVSFGLLVGSFIRFSGFCMDDIALEANVRKSHLYSCIGNRSEASISVRLAFESRLGFDPWSEVNVRKD